MQPDLISRGTSGVDGWGLYVGGVTVLRYRLAGDKVGDSSELLAQGRFRDNKRRQTQFNSLPVFADHQAAEAHARANWPERFVNAVHWKMPED